LCFFTAVYESLSNPEEMLSNVKKSQAGGAETCIGNAELDFSSSALLRAETTVALLQPSSCRYDICPHGEVLTRK
jgi:hypothetical protein